jgi:Tfp pilus assembly protein PilF
MIPRVFCFILFLELFFACRNSKNENIQYASLADSTKYVGIATCRNCHEDKYQTFIHTGMGLSFDHATRQKSSAIFSGPQVVRDTFRDFNYHVFWDHDSLYINEFRLRGKDTIYSRVEQINWIVGSGQHTNSHMTNVNGYVYQIPATFYTQKKQWDLPPGFANGFNTRFSRIIGLECMSCHNAYPKFVEGSENKFEGIPTGIDCERCHGPGGTHVREKSSGNIVDINKEIDYSIVNPAKLPIDYQLDVCQRCHIQGNAVVKEDKSFLDFRPGMRLSEVMDVYMPVFTGDNNEHIMASHAERMKLSLCYTASHDSAERFSKSNPSLMPYKYAMTCVTCHDPHVSVRLTDPEVFNDKCRTCHYANKSSSVNPAVHAHLCTEDPLIRAKVNDNCTTCHMPKNGTIDIPHVTNTDHWIRVPVKDSTITKAKVFSTLACINNMSPSKHSRGIAFLSYFEKFSPNPVYLDSAAAYFDRSTIDSIKKNLEPLVRLEFLRKNYSSVIDYANKTEALNILNKSSFSNDNAWTCYRIGESFVSSGDLQSAHKYYLQAVKLAPYVPGFRIKLADTEADLNLPDQAKTNYELLLRENPKYAAAYVNYGFLCLSAFSDAKKAEVMYDKALALDPDNIQALLNKAAVLLIAGKNADALKYVQQVKRLDKTNPQALSILRNMNKNR